MTEWGDPVDTRAGMAVALAFYRGTLGLTLDSGGDEATNSSLTRDDAHVMIETAADLYGDEYNAAIRERRGNPRASTCTWRSDLPAFYSRLEAAGARISIRLPHGRGVRTSSPSRIPRATG